MSLTNGATLSPTEELVRQAFKRFNLFMLLLWRLGLGGWVNVWPSVGGRIMVLTHTGRKSGLRRRTPVNYAEIDGAIYCTAGFGSVSDWYRNLLVHPDVEIWLPSGWWAGVAEDVSDAPTRLFILRQVLIASGFAAVLAGVDPRRMTDQSLAETAASYRLVRIQRIAACTGPGGPADLDWVWPIATLGLLGLTLVFRRRALSRRR
ncbi:MAG: nitroreductase family deazaflavin-dependent oxidoreductase [Anaerolineae bacterium]